MPRYYPESEVEISMFSAKHYDTLINIITLGMYSNFIKNAVNEMKIEPNDKILDLDIQAPGESLARIFEGINVK